MRILVVVSSTHGATEEIGSWIGEELVACGHAAEVRRPEDVAELGDVDAAVVGSAVYAGRWTKAARAFVEREAAALAQVPVWLFSSGPVGDPPKPDEHPVDVAGILAATRARAHRVFPGRIDREALSFSERAIVAALRVPDGDFRDRDEVAAWAREIAGSLG